MTITPEELGRRLREARERAGLTQEEVARDLEIPRTAVALFEAGKRKISGLELARLAFLYGRTPGDFFAPDFTADGVAVLLRALPETESAKETREAVRRGVALAREVLHLEELLEVERAATVFPRYRSSVLRERWEAVEQGSLLAHRERKRLGLGSAPVPDLGEILEGQGVVVLELPLPDNLSGFTVRLEDDRGVAVGVNAGYSPERQLFSLAHEYCHVLVDHDLPGIVSRPEEGEELREVRANAFAAAFLLPEEGIRDYLGRLRKGLPSRPREAVWSPAGEVHLVEGRLPPHAREIGLWQVCLLGAHFGVSREAVIWRLFNLRLIGEAERESLQAAERDGSARALARLLAAEGVASSGETRNGAFRLIRRRLLHLALEGFHREVISRRRCLELFVLAGVPEEEAEALLERVIKHRRPQIPVATASRLLELMGAGDDPSGSEV